MAESGRCQGRGRGRGRREPRRVAAGGGAHSCPDQGRARPPGARARGCADPELPCTGDPDSTVINDKGLGHGGCCCATGSPSIHPWCELFTDKVDLLTDQAKPCKARMIFRGIEDASLSF
ncbi:unnamed protein product [Urochloa humidicola]